jgi:predicted metallopeptidase
VAKRVRFLLATCEITWIKASKLHFIRSYYAKTRAVARIWGLNRVWQMALGESPSYVIEVISERFDKLSEIEKDKVLLHELTHIPKNFSGALMPHIRRGKRSFHDKVHKLIGDYLSKRQK